MTKILSLLLLMCPISLVAVEMAGLRFPYVYSGAFLPTESLPKWRQYGKPSVEEAKDRVLRFKNSVGSTTIFAIDEGETWHGWGETGITVQFAVKVVEQTGVRSAATVWLSNGSIGFAINLTSNRVFISSNAETPQAYAVDFTKDFVTLRLVVDGSGRGSLYIGDNPTPVLRDFMAQLTDTNRIYFGAPSTATSGTTGWYYLAWASGAHPPRW